MLLGPQRLQPTLKDAVARLGVTGKVATVTAGWEEREGEDAELDEHLDGRTVNLRLFPRGEEVFKEEPEVHRAFTRRRERMRALADLHRPRLQAALEATRALLRQRANASELVAPEIEHAIAAVRDLDAHHLERVRAADATLAAEAWGAGRAIIDRHRSEVRELIAGCDAIAIAGGHVGILLNRLRLFGVMNAMKGKPVIAWSAGAMALTERVVLFHDFPPQGRGDAEVYGPGLGLAPGLVALPHARRRLDLADPARIELISRRFAPVQVIAMNEGATLTHTRQGWKLEGEAQEL